MTNYLRACLYFLKIFLLGTVLIAKARAEINDVQSWWNATAIGSFYKGQETLRFKYWLEAVERLGDHSSRGTQRILRPGIGYALNETTSIWLGAAWIHTGIPITTMPFDEQRIWEQLLWVKKYPQLTLSSRTRLEQRFLENRPKTAWRLREMIKFVSPIVLKPDWSIVGSDEVFWHHNNFVGQQTTGLDQNRFFMGVGYKISPVITAEIGYLNQYVHRRGVPDYLSNNISTTLFFNLY